MAVHFARDRVRVNVLCPDFVYTPLTRELTDDPESRGFLEERHPMGRLGRIGKTHGIFAPPLARPSAAPP
jgi:NAD(P)-dependent dehydrogenase (short-subunit alcohol dehydrogenase family)